jgi:transposase-like protein
VIEHQFGGLSCGEGGPRTPPCTEWSNTEVATRADMTQAALRLRREVAELRRANEILKAAAAFFGAELDRPQKFS